jgi:tRNA nucleotidyltransferase (CCA-adding enzyme)
VRDKLLGIQTSDIDIALSTMTGVQFAEVLTDFYSRNEAEYSQQATEIGIPSRLLFTGFKKTTCNPGMSKNLETAIGKVFGLDIDLVNLRTEVYTPNSRSPLMEFGTAREDAFRRDATINALFYDVDKQEAKDFTGRGLDDMAAGIIRTPLEPYQTFIDDPLRVLRTIRFASKLGYSIDQEAHLLMKDQRIHRALREKVRRERIGIEVMKMMRDRNPSLAFRLIYEAGLYSTVFLGPLDTAELRQALMLPNHNSEDPWPTTWPNAFWILETLLDNTATIGKTLGKMLVQCKEKNEDLWTIAAYSPIARFRHMDWKLEQAVKDSTGSIQATSRMSKLVEDSITHMDDIQSTIDLTTATNSSATPRSTIGMAIRSWGTTWKLQVLYSLLAEVVYEQSALEESFFAVHLERYSTFMNLVLQQNLQDAPTIKPILNGNDINEVFNLKSTGPFMKAALDGLIKWQFDHEGSSKDEAKDWLRTQREDLGIP